MKHNRFTEEQVIATPLEQEAGSTTTDERSRSAAAERLRRELYGRLRDECLNETLFASFSHAPSVLSSWRDDYNHVRPHSGVGGLTPADAGRSVAQPHPPGHPDTPGLQS